MADNTEVAQTRESPEWSPIEGAHAGRLMVQVHPSAPTSQSLAQALDLWAVALKSADPQVGEDVGAKAPNSKDRKPGEHAEDGRQMP